MDEATEKKVRDYVSRPSQRASIKSRKRDWEIPDPTPVVIPGDFERPPTIQEMLRMYLANEQVQQEIREEGFETFEEADDFEPDEEDLLPLSGFEVVEYDMEDEVQPNVSEANDPSPEGEVDPNSEGEARTPLEADVVPETDSDASN